MSLTKDDLQSIRGIVIDAVKEVIETLVIPRFDQIDKRFERIEARLEASQERRPARQARFRTTAPNTRE